MKAGSIRPTEEPSYMKQDQVSDKKLKASFRDDSEALYEPKLVENHE